MTSETLEYDLSKSVTGILLVSRTIEKKIILKIFKKFYKKKKKEKERKQKKSITPFKNIFFEGQWILLFKHVTKFLVWETFTFINIDGHKPLYGKRVPLISFHHGTFPEQSMLEPFRQK